MMASGGRLDLVGGNSSQNLQISSPEGFYQNYLGGPTSRQINSNFFPFVPSLEWDSYVTIGALYQECTPFGENGLMDGGVDWSTFENGGALVADSGSWFVGLVGLPDWRSESTSTWCLGGSGHRRFRGAPSPSRLIRLRTHSDRWHHPTRLSGGPGRLPRGCGVQWTAHRGVDAPDPS